MWGHWVRCLFCECGCSGGSGVFGTGPIFIGLNIYIYIYIYKRVSDSSESYFQDMWRVTEKQHTPILTGLRTLVVDREWEVEVIPPVTGHQRFCHHSPRSVGYGFGPCVFFPLSSVPVEVWIHQSRCSCIPPVVQVLPLLFHRTTCLWQVVRSFIQWLPSMRLHLH